MRLKARIAAYDLLLSSALAALVNNSPTAPANMRKNFDEFRRLHPKGHLAEGLREHWPDVDLAEAEFREALDEILTKFETKLNL